MGFRGFAVLPSLLKLSAGASGLMEGGSEPAGFLGVLLAWCLLEGCQSVGTGGDPLVKVACCGVGVCWCWLCGHAEEVEEKFFGGLVPATTGGRRGQW